MIKFLCENLVQGILKTSIHLLGILNLVLIIRYTETALNKGTSVESCVQYTEIGCRDIWILIVVCL